MRVYLALTPAGLAAARDAGSVDVAVGYAVTPALREWYVEGDIEELEHAAASAAARACLRLLAAEPSDPRRVVLAADVSDGRPAPDLDRAAVRLSGPVRWQDVESGLVDDAEAAPDVRRALAVVAAADAGDDDAQFVVDSVEDHALGWYARAELDRTDVTDLGG
ncbi:MAG: hypothetical protein QOJ60_199 [Actinomycetota bacterium]|nr:hypothetical protein [Actinomycetota bacterium]